MSTGSGSFQLPLGWMVACLFLLLVPLFGLASPECFEEGMETCFSRTACVWDKSALMCLPVQDLRHEKHNTVIPLHEAGDRNIGATLPPHNHGAAVNSSCDCANATGSAVEWNSTMTGPTMNITFVNSGVEGGTDCNENSSSSDHIPLTGDSKPLEIAKDAEVGQNPEDSVAIEDVDVGNFDETHDEPASDVITVGNVNNLDCEDQALGMPEPSAHPTRSLSSSRSPPSSKTPTGSDSSSNSMPASVSTSTANSLTATASTSLTRELSPMPSASKTPTKSRKSSPSISISSIPPSLSSSTSISDWSTPSIELSVSNSPTTSVSNVEHSKKTSPSNSKSSAISKSPSNTISMSGYFTPDPSESMLPTSSPDPSTTPINPSPAPFASRDRSETASRSPLPPEEVLPSVSSDPVESVVAIESATASPLPSSSPQEEDCEPKTVCIPTPLTDEEPLEAKIDAPSFIGFSQAFELDGSQSYGLSQPLAYDWSLKTRRINSTEEFSTQRVDQWLKQQSTALVKIPAAQLPVSHVPYKFQLRIRDCLNRTSLSVEIEITVVGLRVPEVSIQGSCIVYASCGAALNAIVSNSHEFSELHYQWTASRFDHDSDTDEAVDMVAVDDNLDSLVIPPHFLSTGETYVFRVDVFQTQQYVTTAELQVQVLASPDSHVISRVLGDSSHGFVVDILSGSQSIISSTEAATFNAVLRQDGLEPTNEPTFAWMLKREVVNLDGQRSSIQILLPETTNEGVTMNPGSLEAGANYALAVEAMARMTDADGQIRIVTSTSQTTFRVAHRVNLGAIALEPSSTTLGEWKIEAHGSGEYNLYPLKYQFWLGNANSSDSVRIGPTTTVPYMRLIYPVPTGKYLTIGVTVEDQLGQQIHKQESFDLSTFNQWVSNTPSCSDLFNCELVDFTACDRAAMDPYISHCTRGNTATCINDISVGVLALSRTYRMWARCTSTLNPTALDLLNSRFTFRAQYLFYPLLSMDLTPAQGNHVIYLMVHFLKQECSLPMLPVFPQSSVSFSKSFATLLVSLTQHAIISAAGLNSESLICLGSETAQRALDVLSEITEFANTVCQLPSFYQGAGQPQFLLGIEAGRLGGESNFHERRATRASLEPRQSLSRRLKSLLAETVDLQSDNPSLISYPFDHKLRSQLNERIAIDTTLPSPKTMFGLLHETRLVATDLLVASLACQDTYHCVGAYGMIKTIVHENGRSNRGRVEIVSPNMIVLGVRIVTQNDLLMTHSTLRDFVLRADLPQSLLSDELTMGLSVIQFQRCSFDCDNIASPVTRIELRTVSSPMSIMNTTETVPPVGLRLEVDDIHDSGISVECTAAWSNLSWSTVGIQNYFAENGTSPDCLVSSLPGDFVILRDCEALDAEVEAPFPSPSLTPCDTIATGLPSAVASIMPVHSETTAPSVTPSSNLSLPIPLTASLTRASLPTSSPSPSISEAVQTTADRTPTASSSMSIATALSATATQTPTETTVAERPTRGPGGGGGGGDETSASASPSQTQTQTPTPTEPATLIPTRTPIPTEGLIDEEEEEEIETPNPEETPMFTMTPPATNNSDTSDTEPTPTETLPSPSVTETPSTSESPSPSLPFGITPTVSDSPTASPSGSFSSTASTSSSPSSSLSHSESEAASDSVTRTITPSTSLSPEPSVVSSRSRKSDLKTDTFELNDKDLEWIAVTTSGVLVGIVGAVGLFFVVYTASQLTAAKPPNKSFEDLESDGVEWESDSDLLVSTERVHGANLLPEEPL